MNKVYCPDCGNTWNEDELRVVRNHHHISEDLVCPKCGQFEDLQDIDNNLPDELTGNPAGCRRLIILVVIVWAVIIGLILVL